MAKWKIVNVVATASLNQKVNLIELGKLDEVSYDTNVYGGRVAYFRSPNIKGTVSIFASGKMISVGTKSEVEAVSALEYVKEVLVKNGFVNLTELNSQIENIVVVMDFQESIDLEELAKKCKMIYEPDQFPGGIIKIYEPYKVTVLLFASGKAVIAGFKKSAQINLIFDKIVEMIKSVLSCR